MNIRLIADSCCDLTRELKEKLSATIVPLQIDVGPKHFVDDDNINLPDLLASMKAFKGATTTACPSPEQYAEEMRKYDESYVITLSSKLSGSNQSANIAKEIVLAESPNKFIHVFDSLNACAGETRLIIQIQEMIEKGLRRENLVEPVEKFIASLKTNFVLESLDNLIKNGRVNRITGQVASVLSLRPIMGSNNGEIVLLEKARGTQKAMEKLLASICRHFSLPTTEPSPLVIAHCNCPDRANSLRDDILSNCAKVTQVFVVPTAGISTVYANNGGIIVSY